MNVESIIFIGLILIAAGILSYRLILHIQAMNKPEPEHYAYCKRVDCPGCLPSDEDLARYSLLALWGEMLNRCIPQSPRTKTKSGAWGVIFEDGNRYRQLSKEIREKWIKEQK